MTNLVNDTISWSEGTIVFGGSDTHQINPGTTQDAVPVGIAGNLVDNTRYIIFWDQNTPTQFQTIVEASYVGSPSRVIIFEVTGAAVGESAQVVSRDASFGASDKLNSDSFNKIVAGTFSTGALTGVASPTIPGAGVLWNAAGIQAYDGTSLNYLMYLSDNDLRFYTSASGGGKLMSKFSGSDVRYYNQSHFNASDATTTAVLNGKSLTFFDDSGFGAGNETVALIGNYASSTATDADYVGNNGLAIYGTTATAFSGSGANLINFQTDQASPTDYGYIGMYTTGSVDYLTMSVKAGKSIYLFANETPGGANGSIFLAPDSTNGGVTQIGLGSSGSVGQTWRMTSGSAIAQIWNFPTVAPSAGQYLEADVVLGSPGVDVSLKWSTPTFTAHNLHSTALASGSVPVPEYGTFRYTSAATGGDVLAFASAQTNATPAAATERSSFWTMFSEGDSSSNRLVIEPSVTWSSDSGYDNYSYIGWHNYVYSISGYYHNAGDGSASFPSFAFYGDGNTGFYRIASGHTGYSDDGTLKVNFGGHTFATIYTNSGTPTASTVTPEFSVAGSGAFSSYLYVGELRPVTDNISDIGTASRRFDNIYATNSTISTSDVRAKENIYPSTLGLDFINDLNPVSYQWKAKQDKKLNQTHYGIIAQEVIETLKKYGIDSLDDFGGIHGDEETYYGARYSEFVPILMKAVQELSVEIKELKEKN